MVVHNIGMDSAVSNSNPNPVRQGRADRIDERREQQSGASGAAEAQNEQDGAGRISEDRRRIEENEARLQEAEKRRLEAVARREEAIENVIARSEDGDTLQVEEEAADILHEEIGEVVARSGAVQIPPAREEIEAPEVEEEGIAIDIDRISSMETSLEQQLSDATDPANISRTQAEAPQGAEDEEQSGQEQEDFSLNTEASSEADAAAQSEAARQRQEQVEADQERQVERREQLAEDARTQRAEREENAKEQQAQQTSSSFIGISDTRLEQMYLRGEISRYDYETEIDAREAEREQERMESNTAISQDMNNIDRIGRETASGAAAIREATSENANDNLTAEQRLDALDALRNNTREARREEDEKIVWQAQFLE